MHVVKPDADNLVKAELDALCGRFFVDDCQIARLHVEKCYGPLPLTEIEIGELSDGERKTTPV